MSTIDKTIAKRDVQRIWRTPGSKFNWLFLGLAFVIAGGVYLLYRSALATQSYPGPFSDPLREFGIVSFVLVLIVFAYTLRRRFVRSLRGKVQSWLWLHVWFGIITIVIACMHENYQSITHDISFTRERFTEAAFGTTALYALLLLVLTGVIGRLLDVWQARVITLEANSNGVGIIRSVEERLFELSLTVDRLCAGKSIQFKQYCSEALTRPGGWIASTPSLLPVLTAQEVDDFQHVSVVLDERAQLERSLQRQKRAHFTIRVWRYIHIPLAYLALLVIAYHSLFELWRMLILR